MHGRRGARTHAQGNKPITELIEDAYILKVICIQIGGYLNSKWSICVDYAPFLLEKLILANFGENIRKFSRPIRAIKFAYLDKI